MCIFCNKVETMKEVLEGYFTDEEMAETAKEFGIKRKGDPRDVRVAIGIMAAVEMAMDNELNFDDICEAFQLAVARRMLRNTLGAYHKKD